MRLPALLSTAVLAIAATGCGDDEQPADAGQAATQTEVTTTGATAEEPAADVTKADLREVIADPAGFEGQDISVTGDVEGQTSAASVFDLTAEQGEAAVVVVPTTQAGDVSAVVSDKRVTAEGRIVRKTPQLVEEYDLAFENEPNAGAVLEQIEQDYVLVADRVGVGS